ncbi:MAG TPA: hypothetical protein VF137_00940 [Candidatus Dormibacteraeota bacterium]
MPHFARFARSLALVTIVVLGAASRASALPATPSGAGYTVTVFAADNTGGCTAGNAATPTCYYNVDSLTQDASYAYAGYQNSAAADGSSGSSIIARYPIGGGSPIFSPTLTGKNDGLRIDPYTGALWALFNEDANPVLRILDPSTLAVDYASALPTETKFSGGYDDLAFTASGTFISASNPALTGSGQNNYRSVDQISFTNGRPQLMPVLPGQVQATDRSTGKRVTVNLTDPDSLALDPSGTTELNDQGDSTLVFFDKPGSGSPHVSALFLNPAPTTDRNGQTVACPPIVDETTWTTDTGGHFLVADHARPGAIYSVSKSGGFAAGTAYATVAPDNPTLADSLATLDTTSGAVTAVVTGFSSPKGLIFVP